MSAIIMLFMGAAVGLITTAAFLFNVYVGGALLGAFSFTFLCLQFFYIADKIDWRK